MFASPKSQVQNGSISSSSSTTGFSNTSNSNVTMPVESSASYITDDEDKAKPHLVDVDSQDEEDDDYVKPTSGDSYSDDDSDDLEVVLQNSLSMLEEDADSNLDSTSVVINEKPTTSARVVKFANLVEDPPERVATRTPYHLSHANNSNNNSNGNQQANLDISTLQAKLNEAQIALSSEKTLRIRKEKNIVSLAKELEARNETIKNKEAQIVMMAKRLHEFEQQQQQQHNGGSGLDSMVMDDSSTVSSVRSTTEQLASMQVDLQRFEEDARLQSTRLSHAEQKYRNLMRDYELRLRALQAQHASKMDDLQMEHTSAMQKKDDEIAQLTVKVLHLETRLNDDVASLNKRHQQELKQIMDTMKARHSTEMTDVDSKLSSELISKDEAIRLMRDKLHISDEKLKKALEHNAHLQQSFQEELQKKDAAIVDADVRMAELLKEHQNLVSSMNKGYKKEVVAKEQLVKMMAERANEAEKAMTRMKEESQTFQHEAATLYSERDHALAELKSQQESFAADLKRERQASRGALEEKDKLLEQMSNKKQKLEKELEESRASCSALSHQIERMAIEHRKEAESARLETQVNVNILEKKYAKICAEYEDSLTLTVSKFESQISTMNEKSQQDLSEKDEYVSQLESRIEDLELTISSLKEELRSTQNSDVDTQSRQLHDAPAVSFEERFSTVESDYSQAFNELERKHKVEVSVKDDEIKKLSTEINDLTNEKDSLQGKVNHLEASKAELVAKIGLLEEEISSVKGKNSSKENEVSIETRDRMQAEIDKMQSLLEEKELKTVKYEEDLQKLQTEVSNLSYLLDGARTEDNKTDELQEDDSDARLQTTSGVSRRSIRKSEVELKKAIEVVMKLVEELSNAKLESDKHAKNAENIRKEFEYYLLETHEKHSAVVSEIKQLKASSPLSDDELENHDSLKSVVNAEVEDLFNEVEAARNECNERIAAMKVEYDTTISEMTLSHDREMESKVREAREAMGQLKGMKRELEYAHAEIERLKTETQASSAKREDYVSSLRKSHKKLYDMQAEDLAKANKQIEDMTRKLDVARGESRRFCEQISVLRQDFEKKSEQAEKVYQAKIAELELAHQSALEDKANEVAKIKLLLHETQDRLQMTREEAEIYQNKMLELAGKRRSSCKNIRTKLTSVTADMASACANIEDQKNRLSSVHVDAEMLTKKLRESEEKLSAAIDEAEMHRLKVCELESTLEQLQKQQKPSSSVSRRKTVALTLLGVFGMICSSALALFVFYRADALMLDYVCSPVQPGTVVSGGDIFFEAPWWAPEELKESAFSKLCAKRSRSRFAFSTLSGGKFSVYRLNGTDIELMWRKSGARAIVGHDRVLITDRKHDRKQEILYPWRF